MKDSAATPEDDIRHRYQAELRLHAIELLRLGHARLDTASFVSSEEEDITGRLKEEIEQVIEIAPDSPSWVVHYTVYDEEKPSGTGILGKSRPRIDITIKRSWKRREEHPRFRFEAKRLKADNRISAYFGKEGIGCFLRGTYPLSHGEAAMIGYVQAGSLSEWQDRLGAYVSRKPARLRAIKGRTWADYPCRLPHSSVSEHRSKDWPRLVLIHLLLRFC
ncbi:MAG TPA: hypothetical protein DCQ33_05830 [Nitrospira sp.]|nr:hypothetical protein [Nitrospira sp.]